MNLIVGIWSEGWPVRLEEVSDGLRTAFAPLGALPDLFLAIILEAPLRARSGGDGRRDDSSLLRYACCSASLGSCALENAVVFTVCCDEGSREVLAGVLTEQLGPPRSGVDRVSSGAGD